MAGSRLCYGAVSIYAGVVGANQLVFSSDPDPARKYQQRSGESPGERHAPFGASWRRTQCKVCEKEMIPAQGWPLQARRSRHGGAG